MSVPVERFDELRHRQRVTFRLVVLAMLIIDSTGFEVTSVFASRP